MAVALLFALIGPYGTVRHLALCVHPPRLRSCFMGIKILLSTSRVWHGGEGREEGKNAIDCTTEVRASCFPPHTHRSYDIHESVGTLWSLPCCWRYCCLPLFGKRLHFGSAPPSSVRLRENIGLSVLELL